MTTINASLTKAGYVPFSGFIRVTLRRDTANSTTGGLIVAESVDFPLVAGNATITLYPTQEDNTPYLFEIFKVVSVPADNTVDPPIAAYTQDVLVTDFISLVPDSLTPITLDALVSSNGIFQDNTDASFVALASRLYKSQSFWDTLNGQLFRPKGVYSATAYYNRGDVVEYDGSSFLCVAPVRIQGTATTDTTAWQALGRKGANGTGTNGNNAAYAASWSGATDAPSRNAVYNIIQTLATNAALAAYALLDSPAFVNNPTAPTKTTGDRTQKIATTAFVGNEINAVGTIPVGGMIDWGTLSAPAKWLLCDGRAISRTTYSALFTVLGTTYGAGDGTTTFNIPDSRGRVFIAPDNMGTTQGAANRISVANTVIGASGGEERHTMTQAELAAHSHSYSYSSLSGGGASTGGTNFIQSATGTAPQTSTVGSNTPFNVLQPYQTATKIIYVGV